MCNQIRAEFYKVWRRRETYILLGIIVLLITAVVLLLWYVQGQNASSDDPIDFNIIFAIMILPSAFTAGLFMLPWGVQVAFNDQYKHGTLKNEVSFGLSRTSIYLSRWITSLIMCIIFVVIAVALYVLGNMLTFGFATDSTLMALTTGGNITFVESLILLGQSMLYVLPLWMGGMSLCLMFSFIFNSANIAAVCYFFVILGLDAALDLMGNFVHPFFHTLYDHTLPIPILEIAGTTSAPSAEGYLSAWLVGMGWTIVTTVIGLILFNRREIK